MKTLTEILEDIDFMVDVRMQEQIVSEGMIASMRLRLTDHAEEKLKAYIAEVIGKPFTEKEITKSEMHQSYQMMAVNTRINQQRKRAGL